MSRSERGAVATAPLTSCDLRVGGMDCAACAATVEKSLRQLDGVEGVDVDVMAGRVRVRYAGDRVARVRLEGAIRRAGYQVEDGAAAAEEGARRARRARLVSSAAAGVLLAGGFLLELLGAPPTLVVIPLALATVAGGWFVAPRGLRALRTGSLDMTFLMTVAAIGAWIIGEPTEAAATLFLFSIAELLETHSMERARHAIRSLMDLAPAEARVRRGEAELRIPVAEVRVGETVIVRPGEKVAVDGVVSGGYSAVNQAPITGESMPVDKGVDDPVFAGSLNGHGVLEVRATRPADDTTLAHIIHAVEEAQATRAPSQAFVERFARVYTPAVVGLALLVAVLPPLLAGGAWGAWVYRALALLVVGCPCALVISTPVSVVSGLTGAARAGVLIKGGVHLENAGRITTAVFDKTGTLTRGHPVVTDIIPLGDTSPRDVVRRALGVERHSEHPLARAVVAHATREGIPLPASAEFEALPGRGARARVDGDVTWVGHPRLLREQGIDVGAAEAVLARLEGEGKSAVVVAGDGGAVGVLGIADEVRPEAAAALRALRALGVSHAVMLTGDNAGTARAIATQVGIDDVRAELLPDDKLRVVRELMARGERVAVIGDGVNDAPALAAATVGIAMGAMGTDVALETADVALMGDDLAKLPVTIRYARKTAGIIRQNIAVSLVTKGVFVILAVGGWATLWMAVAADMGTSLAVVLNGLRASRVRAGR